MNDKELKELLKKCFGKQKDDKYHAVAMLIVYSIFIFILIVSIKAGGHSESFKSNNDVVTSPSPTIEPIQKPSIDSNIQTNNLSNYSYSYTITYKNITEVFMGKKVNKKEKFTYIKDNTMSEYAILNNTFLKLENNNYYTAERPSRFFRYCDVEKLLSLIEKEEPTTMAYNVSNTQIAAIFNDTISIDNKKDNTISLNKKDNVLKSIDLALDNYISALEGTSLTLTIHIELSNIGIIDDFEISN